jgi:hypothetical protein
MGLQRGSGLVLIHFGPSLCMPKEILTTKFQNVPHVSKIFLSAFLHEIKIDPHFIYLISNFFLSTRVIFRHEMLG